MRLPLNLAILALAASGLGVIAGPHVPDLVAGVIGILSVVLASALICAGLVAEKRA